MKLTDLKPHWWDFVVVVMNLCVSRVGSYTMFTGKCVPSQHCVPSQNTWIMDRIFWPPASTLGNPVLWSYWCWIPGYLYDPLFQAHEVRYQPIWLARGETLQEWPRDPGNDKSGLILPKQWHKWIWDNLETEPSQHHGWPLHTRTHWRWV